MRKCVTISACVLLFCTNAGAIDFTVNDFSDQVDATPGNGVCATAGGTCTLRAAIMEANALAGPDVVILPAGVFNLTLTGAGEDACATGDLDVTQQLSIAGAGPDATIIDGLSADRVLHMPTGVNLVVAGLTIRNGAAPGSAGGGIYQVGPGSLNLSNVNFRGNSSSAGGAVFVMTGNLVAVGGEYHDNSCPGPGAALYVAGNGIVDLANLLLQSNNAIGGPGGGLFYASAGGSCSINGCRFLSNTGVGGAGIYAAISGHLNIIDSEFNDCFGAGGPGGGVYFTSATGNAALANTDFTHCTSSVGGGCFITAPAGSFAATDCMFLDNAATGPGGGIYATTGLSISMTNVTLDSNVSTGGGGGCYLTNNAPVNMTNCPFTGNFTSGPGGGCFLAGGAATSLTAVNVAYTMNTALTGPGGGLYSAMSMPASFANFNFSANNASGPGGGLYYAAGAGGSLSLQGGAVTANDSTGGPGGGVFTTSGGALGVVNVQVMDNLGMGPGGGIYSAGHTSSTLLNVDFIGNEAVGGPGGGYQDSSAGPTTIEDSIFGECVANGAPGGGLFRTAAGALTMTRCAVYQNRATGPAMNGGGIFNVSASPAALTNVTLSGNQAGGNGGGYFSASVLTLTNTTFADNSAAGMGGAIFSGGPVCQFINTILTNSLVGGNCAGAVFVSGSNNIVDDGSCGIAGVGDQIGVDPLIGPLANNGGGTMTHALLAGSPAIDPTPAPGCPGTDQRGVLRPQDAGVLGGAICDIGAFEVFDCNGNGADDTAEVVSGASPDCNANGIPDDCDPDANGNGVPDDCEVPAPPPQPAPCGVCGPGATPMLAAFAAVALMARRSRTRRVR